MLRVERITDGVPRWAVPSDFTDTDLDLSGFNHVPPDKTEKKAMRLLASKIGWRKYKRLKKYGYFKHEGKHGRYKLWLNDPSGVKLNQVHKIGDKVRTLRWVLCVQSEVGNMPKGDVILSRYMELVTDEDNFIKTANFREVTTNDEATRQLGAMSGFSMASS